MNATTHAKTYEVLKEKKWASLIEKIRQGKCTPIVGPEIGFATLANRALLTAAWAEQLEFPFEDRHDLPRVAQFAATQSTPLDAKEAFSDRLNARPEHGPLEA